MDFARAFTYIFSDRGWLGKVIIFVLLMLFAGLIIPVLLVLGYMAAIARNAFRGIDRLPSWGDLGKYLADGFKLAVAGFVYNLPPFIVLGLVSAMTSPGPRHGPAAASGDGMTVLVGILGFLTLVYMLFVTPAMFVLFVKGNGAWETLFDFGRLGRIILTCSGMIALVLIVGLALSAALAVVGAALVFIPCIGTLLVLGMSAYPALVLAHLYGQLARVCPA